MNQSTMVSDSNNRLNETMPAAIEKVNTSFSVSNAGNDQRKNTQNFVQLLKQLDDKEMMKNLTPNLNSIREKSKQQSGDISREIGEIKKLFAKPDKQELRQDLLKTLAGMIPPVYRDRFRQALSL